MPNGKTGGRMKTPTASIVRGPGDFHPTAQKVGLLTRWEEDENIEEVMIIGRTKDGKFVLENTDIHDLYGLLGFVMVKIQEMIKS